MAYYESRCGDCQRISYGCVCTPKAVDMDSVSAWVRLACMDCHRDGILCQRGTKHPRCFDCHQFRFGSPYQFNASIDATGEDSTDPRRVADGTSKFNVGLAPVETVVGTRADGKPRLASRPVYHSEFASKRALHDYAKRQGLEPQDSQKRAIGGR